MLPNEGKDQKTQENRDFTAREALAECTSARRKPLISHPLVNGYGVTDHAVELPSSPTPRVAVSADIPSSHPAIVGACFLGTVLGMGGRPFAGVLAWRRAGVVVKAEASRWDPGLAHRSRRAAFWSSRQRAWELVVASWS